MSTLLNILSIVEQTNSALSHHASAVYKAVLAEGPERRLWRGTHIVQASRRDAPAVITLFQALHAYNASLDNHFALAEELEPLFQEHFFPSYNPPTSLWLLAKKRGQAVGLLISSVHSGSPLFRYNHWVEVEALYVTPAYQG